MDRARPAVVFASLAALAVSAVAGAHAVKYPKRDRLVLAPSEIRLVIDYLVPAGDEARALREIFDRDRSGALDDSERAALGEYLAAQASHFAALTVDDRAVPLARVAADPDLGAGGAGPLGTTVTLAARVALDGAHRVKLVDRHKDRRVDVPVEVVFDRVALQSKLPPLPLLGADKVLELEVAAVKN